MQLPLAAKAPSKITASGATNTRNQCGKKYTKIEYSGLYRVNNTKVQAILCGYMCMPNSNQLPFSLKLH